MEGRTGDFPVKEWCLGGGVIGPCRCDLVAAAWDGHPITDTTKALSFRSAVVWDAGPIIVPPDVECGLVGEIWRSCS